MKRWISSYRYDLAIMGMIALAVVLFLLPLYGRGQIVFSDLAFGSSSKRYMEEIAGVWNERWSTSTLLNAPRLLYILPFYLLSRVCGDSGPVMLKSFITCLLFISGVSMYLLTRQLVRVYFSQSLSFVRTLALLPGALFYALNPWVVFRIQHVYLLCGYSLFPLVLMYFFNAFDPKFQELRVRDYDFRRFYRRNLIDLILLAGVFTVSAAAIHYFFYGLIYLGMFTFLLLLKLSWVNRRGGWPSLRGLYRIFLLKGAVFSLFFALFSFYWLSLYFGSILMDAQVSQHNINVEDTLTLFSRNSSLLHVLYFISYWWPMFPLARLPVSFYIGGGVLLALISCTLLTASRRFPIILMLKLVTVMFVIVATGVKIPLFANGFVLLVTKTPVIGSIFRDPNKVVGLIAVNFSIFLSFGLIRVLDRLQPSVYQRVLKVAGIAAVLGCLCIYANPLREEFIKGYYKPVEVPEEYSQMAGKLTNSGETGSADQENMDSKVLYFPIADNMTQSYNGVATPLWNKGDTAMEKATGDFQVYSSSKKTLFHHEGNDPNITYYMNFIQYLLDNGLSSKVGGLFVPFGIDQLVYHHEYAGQEERQAFNTEMLNAQTKLDNTYTNRYFSLYQLEDKLPYMSAVPRKVVTPYGFSRMESYSHQPGFDLGNFGVLFTGQNPAVPILQTVEKDDYLEALSVNDLLLSQLPSDYYLLPFDAIEDGNAFLKWSKTLLSNNDWSWYLASQNIRNYPFDMDLNAGTSVTFATSKLDVPSYMLDRIKGEEILDFPAMLKQDKFFTADNPEKFNIQAEPSSSAGKLPTLHGEITEGTSGNMWQVAKSGLLAAQENNPYQFSITASGKGTNKMHFKVRFYDSNMEELGISYVVAPTTENDFDGARFYGEYVSPPGTKWLRIDLLTQQRPEQKNYWWIHDISLVDLGAYKKPNTFVMHKTLPQPQLSHIYARVFMNQSGGTLRVGLPDKTVDIPTREDGVNQFQWVDLGLHLLPEGKTDISVTNLQGFNAVNMLAVVPEAEVARLEVSARQAIGKGKLFFVLEAENDFAAAGNIQTERAYPELSMGRGISYQEGELHRTVEIVKDGDYTAALLANLPAGHPGSLTVTFTNQATKEVLTRTILSNAGVAGHQAVDMVVETDLMQQSFNKKILWLPKILTDYGRKEIPGLHLDKGLYTLSIVFNSAVPSLSSLQDYHIPQQDEVKSAAAPVPADSAEGCKAPQPGHSELRLTPDQLEIRYSASDSCSWNISTSGRMPVEAGQEYLIRFDAVSADAADRHLKVLFLNAGSEIVETTYIDEVEERYKSKWNHYEQIVKAPQEAVRMQIQVLAKGEPSRDGYFRMRRYSVIPYKAMITLDQFMLFEGAGGGAFFTLPQQTPVITVKREDSMSRLFTLYNPEHEQVLINEAESPNPLWELNLNGEKQRARIAVNGVTTGFITSGSGSGQVVIILSRFYRVGIGLLILGVLAGAACIFLPARGSRIRDSMYNRKKGSYQKPL